jgi:hypothetical protein
MWPEVFELWFKRGAQSKQPVEIVRFRKWHLLPEQPCLDRLFGCLLTVIDGDVEGGRFRREEQTHGCQIVARLRPPSP